MTTVPRTPDDLAALLAEQLDFLKASCASFDNGFEGEIKRMATAARVLVHDTPKSTSLLTHVGKKTGSFLDTGEPFNDENVLTHSSLTQFFMGSKGSAVRANLDNNSSPKWIDFYSWWDGIVLVDSKRNKFTRKDIVLYLANKDGGAHVDHQIDERYHDLRKNNSMAWQTVMGDGRVIAGDDHVPPTMRQIAHELIRSLDNAYTCQRTADDDSGFVMRAASLVAGVKYRHDKDKLKREAETLKKKKRKERAARASKRRNRH